MPPLNAYIKPALLVLGASAFITACGSGTSGQIDTGAGGGPVAVIDLVISSPENIELVYSFDFNQDPNDNVITYAVTGGADKALLSVGLLNTSEIKFDDAPDFEAPGDADADNVYELEITGTLVSSDRSASQLVYITVTDVAEINPVLNDTGITLCGDFAPVAPTPTDNNNIDCINGGSDNDPVPDPDAQDAKVGRDYLSITSPSNLVKVGEGRVGFDFTKTNVKGDVVSSTADSWSCVKDHHSGLIWQAKQDSALYSDTEVEAYIDLINAVDFTNVDGLCSSVRWRLPTHTELLSLLDYAAEAAPMTSSQFFSGAQTDAAYRTSTGSTAAEVWAVSFADATMSSQPKTDALAIRLVRGE